MLVGICIYNGILSNNNVVFDNNCLSWGLFFIKMEIIKENGDYKRKSLRDIIDPLYIIE